jgi:hypothetical protein
VGRIKEKRPGIGKVADKHKILKCAFLNICCNFKTLLQILWHCPHQECCSIPSLISQCGSDYFDQHCMTEALRLSRSCTPLLGLLSYTLSETQSSDCKKPNQHSTHAPVLWSTVFHKTSLLLIWLQMETMGINLLANSSSQPFETLQRCKCFYLSPQTPWNREKSFS